MRDKKIYSQISHIYSRERLISNSYEIQHARVGMTRKLRFESNVISYGNQTHANPKKDED